MAQVATALSELAVRPGNVRVHLSKAFLNTKRHTKTKTTKESQMDGMVYLCRLFQTDNIAFGKQVSFFLKSVLHKWETEPRGDSTSHLVPLQHFLITQRHRLYLVNSGSPLV